MASSPSQLPPNNQGLIEFGQRLRKLRKDRYLSLVQAAEKVGSSKAALSRYERGEVLVALGLVERLDALYRADGELVAERETLLDGSWAPRGAFRHRWDHYHPASYSGPIWMRVLPDPVLTPARYRVEVRWGNWRLCHEEEIDARGAFFTHAKADDGESKLIEVNVDPACLVTFGQGLPVAGRPVIEINHGWSHWVAYDVLRWVRKRSARLASSIERLLQRTPVPVRRA